MDVNLENLIGKIKKEGVEEARQKADQILKEAHEKEKEIIQQAEKEAEKIINDSKKEAAQFKKNSEKALKQAARNVILSVKERLTEIFDNILKHEVQAALGPEELAGILTKIIGKWSPDKDKSIEVLVSDKDKEKLEGLLISGLKEKAKGKFEIKSSVSVEKGFQIGLKGEDTHYDFSDDGIIESLSVFLNPAVSDIISDKKDG
ncbi:MAG: hypothetical protein ACQESB_01895 [Elusimicrobiota bacterium]